MREKGLELLFLTLAWRELWLYIRISKTHRRVKLFNVGGNGYPVAVQLDG